MFCKNDNSNAKQQTLDNNNNANTDNNNADDTKTDTTANNSNSTGENTENNQTSSQHSFIALLQQDRTGNPQGAVIIAHDVGQNIDWPHS